MINTDLHDIKNHKKTLKECSYDKAHDEHMCTSELRVIDFDGVKSSYLNRQGFSEEKARSVDVLASGNNQLTYLIEFKNGNIKNERHGVQLKIRDSLLMLCDICKCRISDTRENAVFVLVYNEERTDLNWETKRALGLATLKGTAVPYLELDKIEGFLVKKAYMLTQKQFEEKMLPELKSM